MELNRRHVLAASLLPVLRPGTGRAKAFSKHGLWNNATGPHLRGAVITQRRVYPEIDGPEFLGPGPFGTPVSNAALQQLSAAGGNLLVLSHPGIFTENEPFELDPDALANLDDLVTRARRWGLYVIIGFRTGPGRSAFTFHRDDAGSWFPTDMINERVWTDFAYHDAWEAMWRETARHFRNVENVAGYLLMVEPNANQVAVGPNGHDLEIWDAAELRRQVARTPADWSQLARRLSIAVRDTDPDTPVLISPDGYANSAFEANLDLSADDPAVLCVHDYAPRDFTHQAMGDGRPYEPGEGRFEPPSHPRWCMGEFGLHRWAPGGDRYLTERVRDLERAGAGWAVFRWTSGWEIYERRENRFTVQAGGADDALFRSLRRSWRYNRLRPDAGLRR